MQARSRRLVQTISLLLLLAAGMAWVQVLLAARHDTLGFDDAYMFLRYAHNIRNGLGMSWNLDGQHTYGATSLLWAFCVLLASYLPMSAWMQLVVLSWTCSVAAVVALAWAIERNAVSAMFRGSMVRVLPWVAVPLLLAPGTENIFAANAVTGMETMLAFALGAWFCGLVLLWHRGQAAWWSLSIVGFLLYLTRPEAALVVVLLPMLVFVLLPGTTVAKRDGVLFYALLGAFLLAQLAACRAYFHTAFPLSMYMKGKHGYRGYAGGVWHPELLLVIFLTALVIYGGALILLSRRTEIRLIACFLICLCGVAIYLQTVMQIMSMHARYYMPYAELLILPALFVIDRRYADEVVPSQPWRRWMTVTLAVVFLVLSSEGVDSAIRHLEHRHHEVYDAPVLTTAAGHTLPYIGWSIAMMELTDNVVRPLPRGATIAATEVGYLGATAPQVNVIDMAGLNDTQIALDGFHDDAFLTRKPDIIWMPHFEYTYQRGVMFSDPALLEQYEVYDGAANYGIAVRKDSPYHAQIEAGLAQFWAAAYPGTAMANYRVTAVRWNDQPHTVYGD